MCTVGEAERPFTIQSVSKPFIYGLALDQHGVAEVLRRVGVEPTGDPFNAVMVDEASRRPHNPMVNAGAIATADLVPGSGPTERLRTLLDTLRRYARSPAHRHPSWPQRGNLVVDRRVRCALSRAPPRPAGFSGHRGHRRGGSAARGSQAAAGGEQARTLARPGLALPTSGGSLRRPGGRNVRPCRRDARTAERGASSPCTTRSTSSAGASAR
jgi:hypothetical protein